MNSKQICRRTSKITPDIATASGLHLGQTQDQVIAIIGLPTSRSSNAKTHRDDLRYELEAKKKRDPKELAQLRKQNLDMRIEEFHENYDSYFLEVFVHATFIEDRLTILMIDWSEQD